MKKTKGSWIQLPCKRCTKLCDVHAAGSGEAVRKMLAERLGLEDGQTLCPNCTTPEEANTINALIGSVMLARI